MIVEIIAKTLMITSFVAVMMLIVEYFNVQTRGLFLSAIHGSRWRQYLLAAILGAIPGCLGAFVVVALFAHRKVSLGALVAAMIATSGDETFVMLALFPATALLMTLGLAVLGVVSGWLTDAWLPRKWVPTVEPGCCGLEVHEVEACRCFPRGEILRQWRALSPYRATLMVSLGLVIFTIVTGYIGPAAWGWKRITLLLVMGAGLFIVSTVPDHFMEKHLWRHVASHHVPRVFLWTLGALAVLAALMRFVDLRAFVAANPSLVLLTAGAVGVLPESGPHLAFVTMFADNIVPLSVLVASSIVQDGHGMLPLLSTSKRAFIIVKLINLVVGLAVGGVMLAVKI
jgi:hypothetical protein